MKTIYIGEKEIYPVYKVHIDKDCLDDKYTVTNEEYEELMELQDEYLDAFDRFNDAAFAIIDKEQKKAKARYEEHLAKVISYLPDTCPQEVEISGFSVPPGQLLRINDDNFIVTSSQVDGRVPIAPMKIWNEAEEKAKSK